MKTLNVKIGKEYKLTRTGEIVTVIGKNQGRYLSTEPYSGSIKRKRKSFTLSNGLKVYSDKLEEL